MLIAIPSSMEAYLSAAVVRLGYLFPNLSFGASEQGITVAGMTTEVAEQLKRDVLHAVYREKVYAETLPMRIDFYAVVTRK